MSPWPLYRTVRELIGVHAGRAAVIVGGGPSAPREMECAPVDALHISVNGHGFKLRPCEYAIALDKLDKQLRPFAVPLISRHLWADFRILETPQPNSGIAAAWVARLMGCRPIFLIGMDCFSGAVYFHNPTAATPGKSEAPAVHIGRWREFFNAYRGDFRVFGGPLASVLSETVVRDRLAGPVLREMLEREVAGRLVEFTTDVLLGSVARPFRKGATAELRNSEADNLFKQHKARPVVPRVNAA
jgi:hypothetical protein